MKKYLFTLICTLFPLLAYAGTICPDNNQCWQVESGWGTLIPDTPIEIPESANYIGSLTESINGGVWSTATDSTNAKSRMNYARHIGQPGVGDPYVAVILNARDYVFLNTIDHSKEAQTPQDPSFDIWPGDVTTDGAAYELMNDTSDYLYVGHYPGNDATPTEIMFRLATTGSGYTFVVEYSTSTGWSTVSGLGGTAVGFNNTACLTSCNLTFNQPSGWAPATVNNIPNRYWIRIRTTTTPTPATAYFTAYASKDGRAALNGWNIVQMPTGFKGPGQDAPGAFATLPALPDVNHPNNSHVLKTTDNYFYKNISGTWTKTTYTPSVSPGTGAPSGKCGWYPYSVNYDGATSIISSDGKWEWDFYQYNHCPANTLPSSYSSNATALARQANTVRKWARTSAAALEEANVSNGSGVLPVTGTSPNYTQYDNLGSISVCSGSSITQGMVSRKDYDSGIINHAVWFFYGGAGPSSGSTLTYSLGKYPCLRSQKGARYDTEFTPSKWMEVGFRFQLKNTYNCNNINHTFSKMICVALQNYGAIFREISGIGTKGFELQSSYCGNPGTCTPTIWQGVDMPEGSTTRESGTGTGGTNTLTDGTKAWTTNQWKGYDLKASNGSYYTVTANTPTVLTIAGNPPSGAYTIIQLPLPTNVWTASNWRVIEPVCDNSAWCLNANTSDTTPPAVPTSVNATAISDTEITVSWTASIGDPDPNPTGVAGYKIYRCTTAPCTETYIASILGTPPNTTYPDTGRSPSTQYSYYVTTIDNAGNESGASNEATATTSATPPPSVPTNGDFEAASLSPWTSYTNGSATLSKEATLTHAGTGAGKYHITAAGTNVQVYLSGFELKPYTNYRLTFWAYSNTGHDAWVQIIKHTTPYTNYGVGQVRDIAAGAYSQHVIDFVTKDFSTTTTDTRLTFLLSNYDVAGDDYYFDDVVLTEQSPSVTPARSFNKHDSDFLGGFKE